MHVMCNKLSNMFRHPRTKIFEWKIMEDLCIKIPMFHRILMPPRQVSQCNTGGKPKRCVRPARGPNAASAAAGRCGDQRREWDHILVGGLEHFLFSQFFPHIGNVIIPIDFHIFQRGGPTSNQYTSGTCPSDQHRMGYESLTVLIILSSRNLLTDPGDFTIFYQFLSGMIQWGVGRFFAEQLQHMGLPVAPRPCKDRRSFLLPLQQAPEDLDGSSMKQQIENSENTEIKIFRGFQYH